jgi:hypothetical protein
MTIETELRAHYEAMPTDSAAEARLAAVVTSLASSAAPASTWFHLFGRRGRRGRLVGSVAAALVVVVVAGVAWIVRSDSGGHAHRPPTASVGSGAGVTTLDVGLTLRHPSSWRYVPNYFPLRAPHVEYLTNETVVGRCTTHSSSTRLETSCSAPVSHMTARGVLISFYGGGGGPAVLPHAIKRNRTIAGYPAAVAHQDTSPASCPQGSASSIQAVIVIRSSHVQLIACFAGPDTPRAERQFQIMLDTATPSPAPMLPGPTTAQRAQLVKLAQGFGRDGGPITGIVAIHTTHHAAQDLLENGADRSKDHSVWVLEITGASPFTCTFCKGVHTLRGPVITAIVGESMRGAGGIAFGSANPDLALLGDVYRLT